MQSIPEKSEEYSNVVPFTKKNVTVDEASDATKLSTLETLIGESTPSNIQQKGSFMYMGYESIIQDVFGTLFSQQIKVHSCSKDYFSFSVGEKSYMIEGTIGSGISSTELGILIKLLLEESKRGFFDVEVITVSKSKEEVSISLRDESVISSSYKPSFPEINPEIGF